jgi:Ubiquitin carboxyl-terminal hydrolase
MSTTEPEQLNVCRWPRGISNTTGTACHVSSALLILGYALHPLKNGIAAASTAPDASPLIHRLGAFLNDLTVSEDSGDESRFESNIGPHATDSSRLSPLDPSDLFATLRTVVGLESQDLGDAVTALIKLLQCIFADESVDMLQGLQTELIHSGRVYSVLTAQPLDDRPDPKVSKQLKERRLANPYPLQLPQRRKDENVSLLDALASAFQKAHTVDGYRWPTNIVPEGEHDEWTTTKRLHVAAFPPIFMIHLQRFELFSSTERSPTARTKVQLGESEGINVLTTMDLDQFLSQALESTSVEANYRYNLAGGILHVTDPDQEQNNDEEGGHYIAVACSHGQWYLIDDDSTHLVSVNQVCSWLSGDWYTPPPSSDDSGSRIQSGSYLCGVLLVYHHTNLSLTADPILQSVRSYIDSTSCCEVPSLQSASDGMNAVGRRVRVLWNGGTFYSGVVTRYNPQSGKHTIAYDDGDVRDYNLSKKTIEWFD